MNIAKVSNRYDDFIKNYIDNKEVIKDNSYKTLMKFMQIFMKKDNESYDNDESEGKLLLEKFCHFNENKILNKEMEYINLIFIESFHMENNAVFMKEFLSYLLQQFDLRKLLLNFSLYKKMLKFILKRINKTTMLMMINDIKNSETNTNSNAFIYKWKIISFLLCYYSNEMNSSIDYTYIDILFELKNVIQYALSSSITNEQMSIINHFNYIFNKHVNSIKESDSNTDASYNTQYKLLMNYFISKISLYPISIYENFIYILSSLFTINNINQFPQLLPIIRNILISNHSLIHQISTNILSEIGHYFLSKSNSSTQFLKKYISIFEVLDGFNCHLFKSLHPDIHSIITYIESQGQSPTMKLSSKGYYYITNESSITEFFSIEMNYFLILSRKISNHANSRIQKYFVKLLTKMLFKSKVFDYYFTNDFFNIINTPLLYPENEAITYHCKVGVMIEDFYYEYLRNDIGLINDYLKGFNALITNRRIFTYLSNALLRLLLLKEKDKENKEMIKVDDEIIGKVVEIQMKTFSYYNKNLYWRTICLLMKHMSKENDCKRSIDALIRIYYELLNYIMNDTSITIERLQFNENNKEDSCLYKETLIAIMKQIITLMKFDSNDTKVIFTKDNNNINGYNSVMISYVYYSSWVFTTTSNNDNERISSFINEGLKSLFSIYYPIDKKQEILSDIIIIMKLIKLYQFKIDLSKDSFEMFYSSIKNHFISITSSSSSLNDNESSLLLFINEAISQYDSLILLYMEITHYPLIATDIILNQIPFNKTFNIFNQEYSMKYLKMLLFHLISSIHYNFLNVTHYNSNTTLSSNLLSIYSMLITIKDTSPLIKVIYIEVLTLCLLSIKTFYPLLLSDITKTIQLADIFTYFDIVQNYGIFYCLKFFNIIFGLYTDGTLPLNIYEEFITKGVKVLTEKRDNLTFANVIICFQPILSIDKVTNASYQPAIIDFFNKLIYLNENRIWLLLKIASELLIDILKKRNDMIEIYQDVIVQLAICKETRGDDSSMLQTSPIYLKSPFNIKTTKLLMVNEVISKYGLYIRYGVLDFFYSLISNNNDNRKEINRIILTILLNVLKQINSLSSNKPEMQFTDKHRKKLRLSQFLLVLGSIFLKQLTTTTIINDSFSLQLIEEIEVVSLSLFNKINLYSVSFYINLYCIFLGKIRSTFRNELLSILNNPKSKANIVSPSLIILSILLIENMVNDTKEQLSIINSITIQCTSNICNIRGYAQFFINKINNINMTNIDKDGCLSQKFITYLNSNINIQKFFNKFNERYDTFVFLLKNFNVENILKNNFDELFAEIIPIDLNGEYKILSVENIPLDNQDYTNPHSSWRYAFEGNDNSSYSIIEEKKEITTAFIEDFQKKYRPIDNDIYKNHIRKRMDIIVMASLIDKIPNLGGLARTCEVLNIGAMTLHSDDIVKNIGFLSAAASAERWMPLITIPPVSIKEYLISYRKMGYTIIGLEQTQHSIPLKDYQFKEKCVVVLGNEKEGIPQDLINLIDACVIIPQYGEIRSLNVHVSAAIMLWEMVNCINTNK